MGCRIRHDLGVSEAGCKDLCDRHSSSGCNVSVLGVDFRMCFSCHPEGAGAGDRQKLECERACGFSPTTGSTREHAAGVNCSRCATFEESGAVLVVVDGACRAPLATTATTTTTTTTTQGTFGAFAFTVGIDGVQPEEVRGASQERRRRFEKGLEAMFKDVLGLSDATTRDFTVRVLYKWGRSSRARRAQVGGTGSAGGVAASPHSEGATAAFSGRLQRRQAATGSSSMALFAQVQGSTTKPELRDNPPNIAAIKTDVAAFVKVAAANATGGVTAGLFEFGEGGVSLGDLDDDAATVCSTCGALLARTSGNGTASDASAAVQCVRPPAFCIEPGAVYVKKSGGKIEIRAWVISLISSGPPHVRRAHVRRTKKNRLAATL